MFSTHIKTKWLFGKYKNKNSSVKCEKLMMNCGNKKVNYLKWKWKNSKEIYVDCMKTIFSRYEMVHCIILTDISWQLYKIFTKLYRVARQYRVRCTQAQFFVRREKVFSIKYDCEKNDLWRTRLWQSWR